MDRYGKDDLVVILGSPSAETASLSGQTVTSGDPAYAGPLAGIALGLPVFHVFEPGLKGQIPEELYRRHIAPMEMVLDTGEIIETVQRLRGAAAPEVSGSRGLG